MLQLLLILTALISGYFIKHLPIKEAMLNKFLNYAILFILLIMGYGFGTSLNNMLQQLTVLFKLVAYYTIALLIFNYLTITLFAKFFINRNNSTNTNGNQAQPTKIMSYILQSLKYLGYVMLGILLGYVLKIKITYIQQMVILLLISMLFIIGHQLRKQELSLKNMLINKWGVSTAILTVFSSLVAGAVVAAILNISPKTSLMLCSGFGWYTLAAVLNSQFLGQQMGTVSFFIDFLREAIAIILIPTLGRGYAYATIGYSGATAMDFTLPIIKINIGEDALPIAISSATLLNILVPILIPLLNSIKI